MARRQHGMNPCWRLIVVAISLLSLPAIAWGGLREGTAAYVRGDYAVAYREFLPLAQQGDSQAQFFIGQMYQLGRGVPQDYTEAVKWHRKAADQGDASGQSALGYLYQ
jgi:TPR repeat protein